MAIDHNEPDAPSPGPSEKAVDTGEGKQGVGEAWSENRPEDWNPPPGNPGSDPDSEALRENGTDQRNDEKAHDPERREAEVPLSPDDDAPIEEEMKDVDANNSVSSEHPESR